MESSWSKSIVKYGERIGSFYVRPADALKLDKGLGTLREPIYIREARLEDRRVITLICTHGNSSGQLMGYDHKFQDAATVIEDTLEHNGDFMALRIGVTPHPLYILNCFNGRVDVQTVCKKIRVNKMTNYTSTIYLSHKDELNLQHLENGWQQIFMFTKAVPTGLRNLMNSLEDKLIDDGVAMSICRGKNLRFFQDAHDLINACVAKQMFGFRAGFQKDEHEDTYNTFVLLIPCSKIGGLYSLHLYYEKGKYFVTIYDEIQLKVLGSEWDHREILSPDLEITKLADIAYDLWSGQY